VGEIGQGIPHGLRRLGRRPQRFANDRSGLSELETWLSEVRATDD
jgi:transposase